MLLSNGVPCIARLLLRSYDFFPGPSRTSFPIWHLAAEMNPITLQRGDLEFRENGVFEITWLISGGMA